MEQLDNSNNHQGEVNRRCKFFVKKFVLLFEDKLKKFYDEVLGRIKKHNKSSKIVGGTVGLLFRPFGLKPVNGKTFEEVVEWAGRNDHMKKAKRIIYVFHQSDVQTNLREELVDRGLETFCCLERQFMKVQDDDGWQVAIEKLAQDAVDKVFNYINKNAKNGSLEENFYECISTGILHGESKGVVGQWFTKIPHLNSNTISELCENTGIRVLTNDYTKYYNKKGHDVMKNGYRLLFAWEQKGNDVLAETLSQYVEVKPVEEEYSYILADEQNTLDLRLKILKDINEKDTALQSSKLSKEIEVVQLNKELSMNILENLTSIENMLQKHDDFLDNIKKSVYKPKTVSITKPVWFEVRESLKTFTGRIVELTKLENALKEGIIVVSGLSGMGKSELVLYYITSLYSRGYSVIWINAETKQSLEKSFHRFCKQIGYCIIDYDGEELEIKTIVNDVYQHFNDGQCVFVLDNAENLDAVIDFLPHNMPPENKPIIFITSTNCNWKYNMRVQVVEIFLDNFNVDEALNFFKTYLKITNDAQDTQIKDFVSKLNCFPLALQQIAAYINKEETNLRHVFPDRSIEMQDYLKEYENKAAEMLTSKAFQNMDGAYKKSTFTALKILLEKIRNSNQNGEIAMQVLNVASYFAPENIPSLAFKMLTENNDRKLGEVIGLLKQNAIFRQDKMLNLHNLVQLVLRTELREKFDGKISLEEVTLKKALDILRTKFGTQEDVNEYSTHILSVWKYAVKYEELIFKYIVKDLLQMPIYYSTFFHILLERGSYELVYNILTYIRQKYPNELEKIVLTNDFNRNKAIHSAAINGNEEIIKLLISVGAKVNGKKKYNWTALHLAARNGHLKACEVLLDNEANINAKTSYKFTPLHFAIKNQHLEVVKLLLSKGADVNARTKHRFAPLHFAIIKNGWEMVQVLLKEEDIDVKAETSFRKNGLHLSATRGNEMITLALLDRGVDPHALDKFQMTPLQIAVDFSNQNIVDSLKKFIDDSNPIDVSADVNYFSIPPLIPPSTTNDDTLPISISSDISGMFSNSTPTDITSDPLNIQDVSADIDPSLNAVSSNNTLPVSSDISDEVSNSTSTNVTLDTADIQGISVHNDPSLIPFSSNNTLPVSVSSDVSDEVLNSTPVPDITLDPLNIRDISADINPSLTPTSSDNTLPVSISSDEVSNSISALDSNLDSLSIKDSTATTSENSVSKFTVPSFSNPSSVSDTILPTSVHTIPSSSIISTPTNLIEAESSLSPPITFSNDILVSSPHTHSNTVPPLFPSKTTTNSVSIHLSVSVTMDSKLSENVSSNPSSLSSEVTSLTVNPFCILDASSSSTVTTPIVSIDSNILTPIDAPLGKNLYSTIKESSSEHISAPILNTAIVSTSTISGATSTVTSSLISSTLSSLSPISSSNTTHSSNPFSISSSVPNVTSVLSSVATPILNNSLSPNTTKDPVLNSSPVSKSVTNSVFIPSVTSISTSIPTSVSTNSVSSLSNLPSPLPETSVTPIVSSMDSISNSVPITNIILNSDSDVPAV